VSTGLNHSCGVSPLDVAFCWGDNASGKLGDGSMTNRLTPVQVQAAGRRFRQVSVGYHHNCGLANDAHVYCWGANFSNQLGDGTRTDRVTPVAISGGRSFRQVSAGAEHSCGVTTGNAAYCWGRNRYGQIGNGTSGYAKRQPRPIAVLGGIPFSAVDAGGAHTCGVTPGNRGYCWGYNVFGQLGDGTHTQRLTPVPVAGGKLFGSVDTGYYYTCGVTPGRRAYCWGNNGSGNLGDGTTESRSTPVAVAGAT
jgi:alpha-tubulin suppressor-like RCC1 family protein